MSVKKFSQENALILTLIFSAIAVIASYISISKVWGAEGQSFTLFEFLGPIPALILGPFLGIISLLIAKVATVVYSQTPLDFIVLLRFLPVLFGAYYFAIYKNNILQSRIFGILIPIICIVLFCIHPVGSQAWIYSLYWLIPIGLTFVSKKNLFYQSVSTTFIQHAIGSVIWIYFVSPLSAQVWLSLMPLVAIERLIFAIGICLSYLGSIKVLSLAHAFSTHNFQMTSPHIFKPKKDDRSKV